jgi:hypothetical protein
MLIDRSECGVFGCQDFIYASEIPTMLASWGRGARLVALFQCLTGLWLMYCRWAITVNLALGEKLWI